MTAPRVFTRIGQVPRNDMEAALIFYEYARENDWSVEEVSESFYKLQDTRAHSLALVAEIETRWPEDCRLSGNQHGG